MVSHDPEFERRLRENAVLDSYDVDKSGGKIVRRQPTAADAVVHSIEHRGAKVMRHEYVGRAAREVDRVCREYDVPVEPTDVTVVALSTHTAIASASPHGCGDFTAARGLHGHEWTVEEEPDGYVIYIHVEKVDESHSLEETVRHELAHICGWADEGVTYEREQNHAEWLDRLDTS